MALSPFGGRAQRFFFWGLEGENNLGALRGAFRPRGTILSGQFWVQKKLRHFMPKTEETPKTLPRSPNVTKKISGRVQPPAPGDCDGAFGAPAEANAVGQPNQPPTGLLETRMRREDPTGWSGQQRRHLHEGVERGKGSPPRNCT